MAFGLDRVQPLAMADRVRFAELDVLRHVNNKAYFTWFESLRIAYFDLFSSAHYPADETMPRTVLRSGEVRFLREMLMGEDYVTTAAVTAFRNTSWSLRQELWSAGQLRATFDCVMVGMYPDGSGRRYPLPESLKAHFRDNDGAIDETRAS